MSSAVVVGLACLAACAGEPDAPIGPRRSTGGPVVSSDDVVCAVLTPRQLPDGRPPGTARWRSPHLAEWGVGANRVAERIGGNPLEIPASWPSRTRLRHGEAALVPIGDPGQIALVFSIGTCRYTVWIGPGIGIAEAQRFAARF